MIVLKYMTVTAMFFWFLIIQVKTNTYYPYTISAFLELQLLKHHEIRDVEPFLAIN